MNPTPATVKVNFRLSSEIINKKFVHKFFRLGIDKSFRQINAAGFNSIHQREKHGNMHTSNIDGERLHHSASVISGIAHKHRLVIKQTKLIKYNVSSGEIGNGSVRNQILNIFLKKGLYVSNFIKFNESYQVKLLKLNLLLHS